MSQKLQASLFYHRPLIASFRTNDNGCIAAAVAVRQMDGKSDS
jgi:hypothetical protein